MSQEVSKANNYKLQLTAVVSCTGTPLLDWIILNPTSKAQKGIFWSTCYNNLPCDSLFHFICFMDVGGWGSIPNIDRVLWLGEHQPSATSPRATSGRLSQTPMQRDNLKTLESFAREAYFFFWILNGGPPLKLWEKTPNYTKSMSTCGILLFHGECIQGHVHHGKLRHFRWVRPFRCTRLGPEIWEPEWHCKLRTVHKMHLHKIALTYHSTPSLRHWMYGYVGHNRCLPCEVLGSAQLFFEGDTMFHRISPGAKSNDARSDRGH